MSIVSPLLAVVLACAPKTSSVQASMNPALSERPTVASPSTFVPPEVQVLTLSNGIPVWVIPQPSLPLISLRLIIKGGSALDPKDHPGLVSLSNDLLFHGAGDRDANAFAALTERLAIDFDASTMPEATVVSVDAGQGHIQEALDLMADAVLRPRFDKDEVARVIDLQKGDIAQAMDDPGSVSAWAASHVYLGAEHPAAHPGMGTEAGIATLTDVDLKTSWANRFSPSRAMFIAAGAWDAAALQAELDKRFAAWTGPSDAVPDLPLPAGVTDGPHYFLVDNPDSSQSVLRVIMPGYATKEDGRDAASIAATVLGGTFTSRLNRLLREEKGYTYGVRASLSSRDAFGTTDISTSVRADATVDALADLLAETTKFQEGIDEAERTKAIGAQRTDLVETMETRSGIADSFAGLAEAGLPPTYLRDRIANLDKVDVKAVDASIARMALGHAVVLVVGDRHEIEEPLKARFPGTWTVVDKLGNPAP